MDQISQFIINHWILWAAFIALLALTFINELMTKNKKAKEVTPQDVVDKINNDKALVIDIRDKEAFKKGHIIDSINMQDEDIEKPKMAQYKEKDIIVVCAKGIQSSTFAAKLKAAGYRALVMNGGINAWIEANLPLVKGK